MKHRLLLLSLLASMLLSVNWAGAQTKYTADFATRPTIDKYGFDNSWPWNSTVTVNLGGVDYLITDAINGGWEWTGSAIKHSTAGDVNYRIARKDGAPFVFYGVKLQYTNFTNAPEFYKYPFLTVDYSELGTTVPNELYDSNRTVTVSKPNGVPVTTVYLRFSGAQDVIVDDLMVGPTTPQTVAPTVVTSVATNIATTSGVLGGNVTADGGATVTSRGVIYSSTNNTPTIGGSGVTQSANGSGTGTFSQTISGLTPNTTYSVRAYAVNSTGTSYGAVQTFKTAQLVTAAPVVFVPANGSLVSTTTPTYAGTAQANSTITLHVDGSSIGTTTANGAGNWAFTQPTVLTQGSHTIYATAQLSGQIVSANSNTNTFSVDSVRPTVSISSTAGANGSTTAISPIPFTVNFSESVTGFVVGDLTVSNGTFSNFSGSGSSYTVNVTPLNNGAVTVNIPANVAQDGAGNGNTAAGAFSINYQQSITTAPITTAPANGSRVATTTPTYSGTGPATSTVTVYVDGTSVGTASVNGSGNWSLSAPTGLAQGSHTVNSRAQLSGQALSANSNVNNFIVDTEKPTVSITSTALETTTVSPIPVAINFSESVIGFVSGDITVTYGTLSGFAGSGSGYTVMVTPSGSGIVTVNVPANVAQDVAGNGNTAANPFSRVYQLPNNAPSDILLSQAMVAENQPAGTTVGTFTSTDTDEPAQTFTYALVVGVGDTDNASFSINGASLKTAAAFDFETKASYSIRVRTTDSGSPAASFEKAFTITVTNQNELVATFSSQTNVSCFGQADGALTVSASGEAGPYTYRWSAGSSTTATLSGLTAGPYSVTVTAANGFTAGVANTLTQPDAVVAPVLQATALTTTNQPITVTASGCPGGNLNWAVSGGTGQATGSSFVLTQPGNYTLTASCTLNGCTGPSSAPVALQIRPGGFAITGVSPVSCQLQDAGRGQYEVSFTPQYADASGPISFAVVNELAPTTASGPYTLRLYSDNPMITLVANQPGSPEARFVYNWLAACSAGTQPNRPPVARPIPDQTLPQGQAYSLELADYITDPDGQPLTFSATGLPADLSLIGSRISGTAATTGVSTVSVQALDPAGLQVTTLFKLTVTPLISTPAGFTIVGVTTVSCQTLSAGQRQVRFLPQYGGLTGQPITFQVTNELAPTQQAGPYTLTLYTDNPVISLQATQAGSASPATFRYNWLDGCGTTTTPSPSNRAPVVATGVASQTATLGQGYTLVIPAGTFTDPDGDALTLSATGLPAGLSLSGSTLTGTPSTTGVSSVTLTAHDPAGLSESLRFTLTVVPGETPPSATFAITGVTTVNCEILSAGQRRVSFTPRYSGLSGSPLSFSVVNELSPTLNPGPYSLSLYTDNPVITLSAQQGGMVATYRYEWLAACMAPGRQGAPELSRSLQVTVLGNPVQAQQIRVEIRGAEGQELRLLLTDGRGRTIGSQTVERADAVEQPVLSMPQGAAGGLFLLQVSTSTQTQTVKLIKE
jgi:hypothetical protein